MTLPGLKPHSAPLTLYTPPPHPSWPAYSGPDPTPTHPLFLSSPSYRPPSWPALSWPDPCPPHPPFLPRLWPPWSSLALGPWSDSVFSREMSDICRFCHPWWKEAIFFYLKRSRENTIIAVLLAKETTCWPFSRYFIDCIYSRNRMFSGCLKKCKWMKKGKRQHIKGRVETST